MFSENSKLSCNFFCYLLRVLFLAMLQWLEIQMNVMRVVMQRVERRI